MDPQYQDVRARKQWMGVLARTRTARLEALYADVADLADYEFLRPPEIGMAMVRGRAEARGQQFNLGEMTISRCSVKMRDGVIGHGFVAGRDRRHAELAAVFDALLQSPEHGPGLIARVIRPLARDLAARQSETKAKTEATRVNFFTMARGED